MQSTIIKNKQYTREGLEIIRQYETTGSDVNYFDPSDNELVDQEWKREYREGNRNRFIVAVELHEVEGCIQQGRGNNRTWTWGETVMEHVIVVRDFFQNNLVWKTYVNGGIAQEECKKIAAQFGFDCYEGEIV